LLENGPYNTDERNRSSTRRVIAKNGLLYNPLQTINVRNPDPGQMPEAKTQRDTAFQDPRRSRCRRAKRRTSHQRGLVPEGLHRAGHRSKPPS